MLQAVEWDCLEVDGSLGEARGIGLPPECAAGDIDSMLGKLEPTTACPSAPGTSRRDEECYGTLHDRESHSEKHSEYQNPSVDDEVAPTVGIAIRD